MLPSRIAALSGVVLATLLAACTTVPRIEGTAPADATGELLHWSAAGRMAIASGGNGGSGSFTWQQDGTSSDLSVSGPVGLGGLAILLRDGQLRLMDSDGRELSAEAALVEMERRLGAPVPVQNLRYWLLGRPAPGAYQWDASDPQTPVLEQDGWRIAYLEYAQQGALRLPVRVTATRGAGTRIRLLIDRWALGQ